MKYILVIVALFFMGCEKNKKNKENMDIYEEKQYSMKKKLERICVKGLTVLYLSDGEGKSMMYERNPGDKLIPCSMKSN